MIILKKNSLTVICAALFLCCACTRSMSKPVEDTVPIAFPGAEGFGKYTTGGRGGNVYIVTNLNDSGEGSFRECLSKKGPRIVVFDVSGTIHLKSPLNIKAHTTVAGQTAPGDGVCVADYPVKIDGDNVIVRYMRFRMGDRFQNTGKQHGAGHDDALSGIGKNNIIIDHCSISWSTDEVMSVYNGDSTTLQWNILSEPLNYSYHFENGDTDFEHHGYGGIWGGRHFTAHHNLFAHCLSRNPRFAGIRSVDAELVDYRNNVIYNWGNNNIYGGEGGNYNMVGNYYKYGPNTNKNVRSRIVNPSRSDKIGFGKFYVEGNFVDGAPEITANNLEGVHMGNGGDKMQAIVSQSFPAIAIPSSTAVKAYEDVLVKAGASLRRDTLDSRITRNVRERAGRIIDVQGGFSHGTPYEISQTAWPFLASAPGAIDGDRDGMPDHWEIAKGLNPKDAADAGTATLHAFYTNIEMYINSLVP